jgi:hypothetical protein
LYQERKSAIKGYAFLSPDESFEIVLRVERKRQDLLFLPSEQLKVDPP